MCLPRLAVTSALVLSAALAAPAFAQTLLPRELPPKTRVRALPLPAGAALPTGERHRLIVKFQDDVRARATPEGGVLSLSDADLSEVRSAAQRLHLAFAPAIRLPESTLGELTARAAARSGRAQPDLAGILYAALPGASPHQLEDAGAALQELPALEFVEIETLGAPPPGDIAPATPDLSTLQDYFAPDPGLDAAHAWSLGVTGQGIRLSDCEYGWVYAHEDLVDRDCHPEPGQTIHPISVSLGFDEHGTAAIGEASAVVNSYGCSGMTPGAEVYTYPERSVEEGYRRLTCITHAIANSAPGDVVMLEMQAVGAGGDYAPAETSLSIHTVTKTGVDAGVVVVAPAGNGNQNLDSASYATYLSWGDSGAIIVGAGSANLSHDKLSFSTYGSRVNVQGWGDEVFSLGYGYYAEYGGDKNQRYISAFGGTSSATPLIAAACALVQEYAVQTFGQPLAPQDLRDLLVTAGVPQGTGGHIGPFPALEAAFDLLFPPWSDAGFALAGTSGEPRLRGNGSLVAGDPWKLELDNARPQASVLLVLGLTSVHLPFLGGTLVPSPDIVCGLATDAGGGLVLGGVAPAGILPGVSLYFQCWIDDPAGPQGAAASNAVAVTTP